MPPPSIYERKWPGWDLISHDFCINQITENLSTALSWLGMLGICGRLKWNFCFGSYLFYALFVILFMVGALFLLRLARWPPTREIVVHRWWLVGDVTFCAVCFPHGVWVGSGNWIVSVPENFLENFWNEPLVSFINFIWNDHECKILVIIRLIWNGFHNFAFKVVLNFYKKLHRCIGRCHELSSTHQILSNVWTDHFFFFWCHLEQSMTSFVRIESRCMKAPKYVTKDWFFFTGYEHSFSPAIYRAQSFYSMAAPPNMHAHHKCRHDHY